MQAGGVYLSPIYTDIRTFYSQTNPQLSPFLWLSSQFPGSSTDFRLLTI